MRQEGEFVYDRMFLNDQNYQDQKLFEKLKDIGAPILMAQNGRYYPDPSYLWTTYERGNYDIVISWSPYASGDFS